ncbi:MAG: 3'-5' exonuclease [Atopobium sp.]|nr:3'-5' exonuclease [Atopobium sp.]
MTGEVNPAHYLVLDVETNGLKAKEDDLLSISLYKPDDGRLFDRFLPLEKQDELNPRAAAIHGIRKSDLRGKKPLSQEEVNDLMDDFEMRERTVLTFGGRGFDERFLRQYFADHDLTGIEQMTFFDFQTMVHASPSRFFPASKNNLCRAFGILGVAETHTSANDCLLEWRLFKSMGGRHILVDGHGRVFKLQEGYIYPASYIDNYPRLRNYAGIPKRYVQTERTFELELSDEASRKMVKFPNNISGNALEHLIDSEMQAKEIDSREYLLANKMKLEYVGSFTGTAEEVPTEKKAGGAIALSSTAYEHAIAELERKGSFDSLITVLEKAKQGGDFISLLSKSDEAREQFITIRFSEEYDDLSKELARVLRYSLLTDAITESNLAVKPEIGPLIDYLKDLLGPSIMSQELVVNSMDNCLALCDLSSERAVIEIKTGQQGYDLSKCSNQLYYCSNSRPCYALHVEWGDSKQNTRFMVERVFFSEDRLHKPRHRSERSTRKYRIRHAVTDWRLSNLNGTPRECASSLWLEADEVKTAWEKADPSVAFQGVPSRGKRRETFESIVSWRKEHPTGTRLELADDCKIPVGEVEHWWFQAAMPMYGGSGSSDIPQFDDESIRNTINDLIDESNLYSGWTDEQILDLQKRTKELTLKAGIPTANLHWRLLQTPEQLEDSNKKSLVSDLRALENVCKEAICEGIQTLRIPLSLTRYKTRSYYMELNPAESRIAFETRNGQTSDTIEIMASGRKTALFNPEDKLYDKAMQLVGKRIVRAYIERPFDASEGQLVFAVANELISK